MADHSNQAPLTVVQTASYGHADTDSERWHDRWTSLSKVIQYTRTQISRAQHIAGQELETFQSDWAQAHPESGNDLHQSFEEVLANWNNLLVDLKSTTPEVAEQNELAILFLSDIAHRLIPMLSAYQATQECTDLLETLHDFAEAVYSFLAQELYPKPVTSGPVQSLQERLSQTAQTAYVVSERYTADVVMAALMEQISIDLNIIKQVFHQRYSESHHWLQVMNSTEGSDFQDDPQRPSLMVADQLAQLALQPAIDHGFFDNQNKTVVTYLNRRVDVRLLPYHSSVLIGIPYTAQTTFSVEMVKNQTVTQVSVLAPREEPTSTTYTLIIPTEYLAIPHEIGHHLYRYGKQGKDSIHQILQRQLRARLTTQPETLKQAGWRLQWAEEIFADAYGCMIAGPISVFGFQEYLTHGQPVSYDHHAHKHPVNVFRPLIQSQILRCLTDQAENSIYAAASELLDARWQQWVKDHWPHWVAQQWPHGYDEQTNILLDAAYEIDGKTMSGRDILDGVQEVIDASLLILKDLRPANEQATWAPLWNAHNYGGQAQIANLYQDFVSFAFRATIQATLDKYRNLVVQEQLADSAMLSPSGQPWLQNQLEQLQQERLTRPVLELMVDLILFEGWSTEEPGPKQVGG